MYQPPAAPRPCQSTAMLVENCSPDLGDSQSSPPDSSHHLARRTPQTGSADGGYALDGRSARLIGKPYHAYGEREASFRRAVHSPQNRRDDVRRERGWHHPDHPDHYHDHHYDRHTCCGLGCRTMVWGAAAMAVVSLAGFWMLPHNDPPRHQKERVVAEGAAAASKVVEPPRPTPTPPPASRLRAQSSSSKEKTGGHLQRVGHQPPPPPSSSSMAGVAERAELWAGRRTVILTFGSIHYTASLMNWLVFAISQNVTNWAIACLDAELGPWLQARGARCHTTLTAWRHGVWESEVFGQACDGAQEKATSQKACLRSCEYDPTAKCKAVTYHFVKHMCVRCQSTETHPEKAAVLVRKRTRETLWFARWALLVRLLQDGLDVLLSDADAIIIKHPKPSIITASEADLVAQRGSFPDWISDVWGAAICMGFSLWRSTDTTKRFAVYMHSVILGTGDDQVAVNVALQQLGIRWTEGKVGFVNSSALSNGADKDGFRVSLLPHNTFPRRCADVPAQQFSPGGSVVVAHCFQASKTGHAKKREAQQRGLWLLKEGWEKADPVADLNAYLASIRSQ
eukprot:TRINITY_DN50646_c0_g1_i1.p1 TRINITY_DN50646_c0_g1~~TRINITY_DN50646_c0_g1_i1.p1  ORF type:complete len:568 (+),score=92.97 TRINITY_DN50646_c0_g1_i1:46-1749(+)